MNTQATILIIDPDKTSSLFLKEVLLTVLPDAENYQILETAYGNEAIKWCQKIKPELVFTEIRLKDVEGFGVIRKIKELCPEIPIITETAMAEPNFKQQAYEAGSDGYLIKPLDFSELGNMIKAFFEVSS